MSCNKCVDVLVGLSAGSEGKGKYVSILQDVPYTALVRTGSSNAAHTVHFNKKPYVYHIIPCGAMHFPHAKLVIGAAAQLDIGHLKHEIQVLKDAGCWHEDRLIIDPNAVIVDTIDKVAENGGRMPDCGDLYFHPIDCERHTELGGTCAACDKLPKDSAWKALGSTTHGCGANLVRKTIRGTKMAVLPGQELDLAAYIRSKCYDDDSIDNIADTMMEIFNSGTITDWGEFVKPEPVRYADEDDFLKPYIDDTVSFLNSCIDNDHPILLEGTQGSMLSLHHGYRRKTTSRDTNASNWCADAGISPLAVRDIYGVTRTFPIRVAGNSGPMSGQEITWEEVTEHATGKPIAEWMMEIEDRQQYIEYINLVNKYKGEINKIPDDEILVDKDTFDMMYSHLSMKFCMKGIDNLRKEIKEFQTKIDDCLIVEITTATKRKRRVFTFGESDFRKAININRPTHLMLSFVDYLKVDDKHKTSWGDLTQDTRDWITTLESKMDVFFKYLSTGPDPEHVIVRD